MIQLARILYPTDFSELSRTALKYAVSFAREYEAQLHCLHVVDESFQYWLALGPDGQPLAPNHVDLIKRAEKDMADFAKQYLAEVPNLVTQVLVGQPFVEIIRYARTQAIDLICMATHGRTGLTHILMGSVAERVVRKAPCPVLSCRSPEHEFIMP